MEPFRTILFATDLSESSNEAFRLACSLAVENQTRLIVLHVVEPTLVAEEPAYFNQLRLDFRRGLPDESRLEALKRELREIYTPSQPLEIEYLAREGDASAEILHQAEEVGSDLIVMGTHGRTGLRWLLAGSVAISVLRSAHCPVLAIHSTEQPSQSEEIKVILHPTDFSQGCEAALSVARLVARGLGARLVVLHVAPFNILADGTMVAPIDPRAVQDALEDMRKRLEGPDLKYPVETRFSQGDAAAEVLRIALELECGLIVMGTHGRTGLGRLLMGSVVEFVMPRAACPVLVVIPWPQGAVASEDRPAEKVAAVQ